MFVPSQVRRLPSPPPLTVHVALATGAILASAVTGNVCPSATDDSLGGCCRICGAATSGPRFEGDGLPERERRIQPAGLRAGLS
jgi:hypothetical protein